MMRRMNDIDHAVDAYIGELARLGRTTATRTKYQWLLWKFCEHVNDRDVQAITRRHCTSFLDRWADSSPSTLALHVSILAGFFDFLVDLTLIEESPMATVRRPPRKRPEDLDVITVSDSDVERMFAAVATPPPWDELLCFALLGYLGPRRNAAARLRRRDVDLERGFVRFREKGGKIIEKPLPLELAEILHVADADGLWLDPDDYVIPNRRPPRRRERSNKVVYRIVTDVAKRARVRAHPHAIRAAFAVRFDAQHPREHLALQDLLGHARFETTQVYLRRRDKARAMEAVRDLTWSPLRVSVLSPDAPSGIRTRVPAQGLPDALRRKLDELRARSQEHIADRR